MSHRPCALSFSLNCSPFHCLVFPARMSPARRRACSVIAGLAAQESAVGRAARCGPTLAAALLLLLLVSARLGRRASGGTGPLPPDESTSDAKGGTGAAAERLSPIPGCLHLQRTCVDQERVSVAPTWPPPVALPSTDNWCGACLPATTGPYARLSHMPGAARYADRADRPGLQGRCMAAAAPAPPAPR